MRNAGWLIVVSILVTCSGCIGFHGPEDLRRDLVQVTGVELDREMGVSVGRFGVALARWFTPEEEIPLKGVRRVQVGVYEVTEPAARRLSEPPSLPDWHAVVEIHDSDEDVFVLMLQREDEIRGLLVVVAEEDEWVLVRVRGKLERVVEQAMRMAFERANRDDLAEPAIADYRASQDESVDAENEPEPAPSSDPDAA